MRKKIAASSEKTVLLALAAVLLMAPALGGAAVPAAATTTATGLGMGSNHSCTRRCGNIDIPYPFGIEPGCYQAAWFNLTCNHSQHHQPAKLFLGDGTIQVLNISVEDNTVSINSTVVSFHSYTTAGTAAKSHTDTANKGTWGLPGAAPGTAGSSYTAGTAAKGTWGLGLPETGPYFLSESASMLQATGCGSQVSILGGPNNSLVSSCTATCPVILSRDGYHGMEVREEHNGMCTGIGCCQANILIGYSSYAIRIDPIPFATTKRLRGSVYIVDQSYSRMNALENPETFPATLDWIISRSHSSKCPDNKTTAPECVSTHSYCQDSSSSGHGGYTCRCADGYQGNPYVQGGCKDIDECKYPDQYVCYDGFCNNTPGSYICQCNTGFTGNASVPNGCTDIDECKNKEAYSCYGTCQNSHGSFQCQCPEGTYGNSSIKGGCITIKNSFTGFTIGLAVGGGTGLLLLALGGPYILRKIKLQKLKKKKQRFFEQNHGLLLQQLIPRNTDIGQRMIITLRDLEKATDNFDRARIVGSGGHGLVFKGILDLQVVAIKKSKIVVQREIDDFINEVVVLSQVNHRNVVKLLGCCLESEVPLLIYEFISNGTLCHHLHVDGPISLSWDDRLRIAAEVAKALSYLHSSTSMPIFHRDIKSANILLDDALTAKVSDFGASRYIPIDRTGVTTAVQGTMGYLDPMYYYNGRLTGKSDVFSFGVLLVELLTRKKPYIYRSVNNDGLVSHFVSLLGEGKLVDIIDPQVIIEEECGEIQEVATLAAVCTKLKGEDRPTMREVEMTLESLLVKKRQVQYNRTPMRNDGDEATAHYMAIGRDCKEASRQYTMEEEFLLSASYPR